MDWEEAFEPQILDRGHDYQRRGLVQDLQVVGETLTATVLGSQAYRLTITLDAGEMTAAACDCPYALEHATCKHMAAVLVQQASLEQLRQFVTKVLTREPSLIKTFKQIVIPEVVSSDLKGYQAMVDTIFDRYADEDGFIDYEAAEGFADDLLIFLEDDLQDLIDAGKVDTVLQVLMNLFTALDQLDIDDSDGELIALLDQCTDDWGQVMEQATLPQKTRVFAWLQDQLSRPLDVVGDSLEDLLFNDFTEPAFLTAKLTLTAQRFQTAKRQRNDWEMDHWAGRHLRVMDQAGVAPEKIKAFCQANLSLNQVRQFYVTFCIQHQDYPTAIQLLKTGKQVSDNFDGRVSRYSRQLKDLYQQLGQTANYRHELWQLVTRYQPADYALFLELKGQSNPQAWPEERDRFFKIAVKTASAANLEKLYAEEELYPRLLEAVLAEDGLEGIRTYATILRPRYARPVLKKYQRTLQDLAVPVTDRKHYQHLVTLLREMASYPMGQLMAEDLVSQWRQQYPRRRAMLDELSRF